MEREHKEEEFERVLFHSGAQQPGSPDSAMVEQYKIYLEMLDKVSERRQQVNNFYLGINTGLCAFVGFLLTKDVDVQFRDFLWAVPAAGVLLSYFWYRIVTSYRGLNSGKFCVVHAMEKRLPFAPFTAEWKVLGEGKDPKKYTAFTKLEILIPGSFALMYVLMFCYLWWRPFTPAIVPGQTHGDPAKTNSTATVGTPAK